MANEDCKHDFEDHVKTLGTRGCSVCFVKRQRLADLDELEVIVNGIIKDQKDMDHPYIEKCPTWKLDNWIAQKRKEIEKE